MWFGWYLKWPKPSLMLFQKHSLHDCSVDVPLSSCSQWVGEGHVVSPCDDLLSECDVVLLRQVISWASVSCAYETWRPVMMSEWTLVTAAAPAVWWWTRRRHWPLPSQLRCSRPPDSQCHRRTPDTSPTSCRRLRSMTAVCWRPLSDNTASWMTPVTVASA